MIVFVLSFIVIALCILGLSLSLIYGRGPIKGSCGATENLRGFDAGDGCSGACATKRSDERDDCKHRHSCPAHHETDQDLIN
jgi:hypothetical protein